MNIFELEMIEWFLKILIYVYNFLFLLSIRIKNYKASVNHSIN